MVLLSPYVLPSLSAAGSEFLRVLWFSRFRPEVVSGTRWRGKPEGTSPFDS
jgi:hypothetical protein